MSVKAPAIGSRRLHAAELLVAAELLMAVESIVAPTPAGLLVRPRLQARASSRLVGSVGDCWVTGSMFDLGGELASWA